MDKCGFVIDLYNKYQNNSNVVDVFTLQCGERLEKWCIRRITQFEWGVPHNDNLNYIKTAIVGGYKCIQILVENIYIEPFLPDVYPKEQRISWEN